MDSHAEPVRIRRKRERRSHSVMQTQTDLALWQPIETAPKDGTVILVWCPDGAFYGGREFGPAVLSVAWGEVGFAWSSRRKTARPVGWMITGYHEGDAYPDPTHWRPMPPPPEA